VYISPIGILNSISFKAISYKYNSLIQDKYTLQYLSSTRNLTLQKKSNFEFNSIALFGGIEYDVDTTKINKNTNYQIKKRTNILNANELRVGWKYLPNSLIEINSIQNLFTNNNIDIQYFSGINGSEENFKLLANVNSPSILHIATHGFYFPTKQKDFTNQISGKSEFEISENPLMRSGLVLAGGGNTFSGKQMPDYVEDGILTANEVSQLYFQKTKLVVLSACQTGLGDVKGNEGVYGLQRALKLSGVEYLILSLWSVPDKQTQEMMNMFYQKLYELKNVRVAFDYAQNEMRKKYPIKDWAAFILIE